MSPYRNYLGLIAHSLIMSSIILSIGVIGSTYVLPELSPVLYQLNVACLLVWAIAQAVFAASVIIESEG